MHTKLLTLSQASLRKVSILCGWRLPDVRLTGYCRYDSFHVSRPGATNSLAPLGLRITDGWCEPACRAAGKCPVARGYFRRRRHPIPHYHRRFFTPPASPGGLPCDPPPRYSNLSSSTSHRHTIPSDHHTISQFPHDTHTP